MATHIEGYSLWSLSFKSAPAGKGQFLVYTILTILGLVLSIVAMLFDKGWLFTPPQIAMFLAFENLLSGLVLTIAFLPLCYDYAAGFFGESTNPIALAMKLAFRLHSWRAFTHLF